VKINRRAVAAVPAVALIGVLTACSSGAEGQPRAAPSTKPISNSPSAVASSAADNKALTREGGAKKYEEIVKVYNDVLDKCWNVVGPIYDAQASSPGDFPKIRKACVDMGKANRRFADDLGAVKWPAEAQADVGRLIDEIRADQLAWDDLAKVRSHDDLFDPEHPFQEQGDAADLVRAHLGLPPAEEL
jgi:hypothetical protein